MSPTVIYRDGRPSKTYKMCFDEAVCWASHLWADGYTGSADDAKFYMLEAASERIVAKIFERLSEPKQTFEEDIDLFYETAVEIARDQIRLAADAYSNEQIQTAKELLAEIMPKQEEVEAVFNLNHELTCLNRKEAFLKAVRKVMDQWETDNLI